MVIFRYKRAGERSSHVLTIAALQPGSGGNRSHSPPSGKCMREKASDIP
jgi:hypothetical protein